MSGAAAGLLGAYLHQDWQGEFGNADRAVAAIVAGEPLAIRQQAAAELRALLDHDLSEADLERQLNAVLCCEYRPQADGLTVRAWLSALAAHLDR